MPVAQLVTHRDAEEFETRYHRFVFGDRPEWWNSAEVVYTFDPVGPGPEMGLFACGLEDAAGLLHAYNYDIASAVVLPAWKPDPERPKDSKVPQHRLGIGKQWSEWREEREVASRPHQIRAIRQQLFAHAPREHQPGVTFAFSELPALVRTHDPYEAARAAAGTIAKDQRAVEASWAAFAGEVVSVFERLSTAQVAIAALLMGEHSSLQVPKAAVLRAVRGSKVASQVREAYALMPWRVRPWTARADKDQYLPVARWSELSQQRQAELTHVAHADPEQPFRKATALYYDHLHAEDLHDGHREAQRALVGRLADWHAERYADDLATALAAFHSESEFYLGVTAAEAKAAATKVMQTPFSLLDVLRRANLTYEQKQVDE